MILTSRLFDTCEGPRIGRRMALLGLTSAVVLGRTSLALADAATDNRFVVILLRGAMDGMSAVIPYGDANLAVWRKELLPPAPGQQGGMLDLGGFYGLNPVLTGMHALYQANELLPVHAVAGSYRSRSHFEAQDYLESGSEEKMSSGWLNRVLEAMPKPAVPLIEPAVALNVTVPLLLRGPVEVGTWAPASFAALDAVVARRLAQLNAKDPITGPAFNEALRQRGFSDQVLGANQAAPTSGTFAFVAASAGQLMRTSNGPRVAALEVEGWDTHSGQPARLNAALAELDEGMSALKTSLGDVWKQTVVLVITEFGRTVRANGTLGTDHGTGTAAFVAGGPVAGGRVVANWPGLSQANLFEDRDLQPTTDLRAIAKGLLVAHLGIDAGKLAAIFPGSERVEAMAGLLRG